MIWSTLVCSLKSSSQSKWQHPTANAPKNYVKTFIYPTTNVPYPWLFMGYSLHKRQYWVGSTSTMLCTTLCCVERRACGVTALCRAIRQNAKKTTQIVCAIKLTGRPTVLLNAARDGQNISSTWHHILQKAIQTYDVKMTCQRFIYSVSVTNNHVGPEVQALHTALWLKINRITCCTIDFQGITANTRQKYEVHIKANKGCNKQEYSPPMSKYAKNTRPNKSAPSFFNSSLNLLTIPFVGTMTVLDSMPSSYPSPMPCNWPISFVKRFSVFPSVTCLSDSKLKLAYVGHSKSFFIRTKASQWNISNGFL